MIPLHILDARIIFGLIKDGDCSIYYENLGRVERINLIEDEYFFHFSNSNLTYIRVSLDKFFISLDCVLEILSNKPVMIMC